MNRALINSAFIHGFIALFVLLLFILNNEKKKEVFNFTIVEKEIVTIKKKPKIIINGEKSERIKNVKNIEKPREVFGVKRKTLTSSKGSVQAKVGNTLTKEEDNKILKDNESDKLPIASEEFLITSMPRPINEIRPIYPNWAKEQKLSGSVVFEILIDKNGIVRQANLLKGIHPELDKLAKEAILKFQFKPAYIEKKPTAVRIKYAIKYLLES
jgi:TonB family protein